LTPDASFSASKIAWLLESDRALRTRAESGELAFGTVDSWLIWHLTGGKRHLTDATNAARTMLFDIRRNGWSDELLNLFNIPVAILPEVVDSIGASIEIDASVLGISAPVTGIAGDQHAALFGQACFAPGEAKNTYGTGNFMLLNTGRTAVPSKAGLLTTAAYRLTAETIYALEGSIAVTGSAVQWLRDQLGIIGAASEIETLAVSVPDNGGIYFVPAFSGLFAPYWRSDARGAIVGLSRFNTKAHLARATLEAICYQTRAVLDAMTVDSGVSLDLLKVDGGATVNDTLMQLQADILGVPVVRPIVAETTALGAAYAAGLAVGFWTDLDDLRENWRADRQWDPQWSADQREEGYAGWKKALERTFGWI
jgi:glycerol kinase